MTAIATLPTDGLAITERHRPSSLDAIVGQGYVVEYLTDFLEAPHSGAFLFLGPTGTGKSSTARALAGELGCDLTEPELGGYRVIRGGEQTADTIREAIRNLWARPMFSRDGWKVLAVEEGDVHRAGNVERAQERLLPGRLEPGQPVDGADERREGVVVGIAEDVADDLRHPNLVQGSLCAELGRHLRVDAVDSDFEPAADRHPGHAQHPGTRGGA